LHPISIYEGNDSFLSYFTPKKLNVDVTQSVVLCGHNKFDLVIEEVMEQYKYWVPEEERTILNDSKILSDPKAMEYKKVKRVFHLTLPESDFRIDTIIKYHREKSEFFVSKGRLKFPNAKLLWSWKFQNENNLIKLNLENDEKYGSGYYLASDAALAHHFRTQTNQANNSLLLSQVSLGRTYYYTDNNPKAFYSLPANSYHTLAVRENVGSKEIEGWTYVIPSERDATILPTYLISYSNNKK